MPLIKYGELEDNTIWEKLTFMEKFNCVLTENRILNENISISPEHAILPSPQSPKPSVDAIINYFSDFLLHCIEMQIWGLVFKKCNQAPLKFNYFFFC